MPKGLDFMMVFIFLLTTDK